MPPNPFIGFYQDPVGFLATLGYVLLLLSATIAVAGVGWSTLLHLSNAWEHRHNPNKFGPRWEYVPPLPLFGRAASLCLLGAIEAFLLGGLIYLVG